MRKLRWPPERIAELIDAWERLTPDQLVKRFKTPIDRLREIREFYHTEARLRRKVVRRGRLVVTVYAPGYADGAADSRPSAK